jgi:hypothetical protein
VRNSVDWIPNLVEDNVEHLSVVLLLAILSGSSFLKDLWLDIEYGNLYRLMFV